MTSEEDLNLDSIGRYVRNRRLCWLSYAERMDESSCINRCRAVEVAGSVGKDQKAK